MSEGEKVDYLFISELAYSLNLYVSLTYLLTRSYEFIILQTFVTLFILTFDSSGMYFLEDLHVSRHPNYEDSGGQAIVADVIRDWIEQLMIPKSPIGLTINRLFDTPTFVKL
mgnify:CR=1 FL=1